MSNKITQKELKKLIKYDKKTGEFFSFAVNRNVGHVGTKGYLFVNVKGKRYRAHRLAWFYVTGEWPDIVDHIDGNITNNKWKNLRQVNNQENQRNTKIHSHNTSGHMGVRWCKSTSKWRAVIRVDSKEIHLGRFKEFKDAVKARKEAEEKYGFHRNHGKR